MDSGKSPSDLIDSDQSFRAHACASCCACLLGLSEDVLKGCRKIFCKVFRVQIEDRASCSELFQHFKLAQTDQAKFKAAPPQHLPFFGHDVAISISSMVSTGFTAAWIPRKRSSQAAASSPVSDVARQTA